AARVAARQRLARARHDRRPDRGVRGRGRPPPPHADRARPAPRVRARASARAMTARREALLSAAVAGTIAALLAWLGPPGSDLAAHAYQRTQFIDHGFQLWN